MRITAFATSLLQHVPAVTGQLNEVVHVVSRTQRAGERARGPARDVAPSS